MKATYLIGLALIISMLCVLRPVAIDNPEAELNISGVVEKIHTPCCGDINISLSGDEREYYVNRAIFSGVDIKEWQNELEGQEVQIKGVRHISLLNPLSQVIPIKTIIKDDEVLWSNDLKTTAL